MGSFRILQVGPEQHRPPLSYKVCEYFMVFIERHILIPQEIILQDKWNIWLSMMFFKKARFGPAGVYVYPPTIMKENSVKSYPIQIPIDEITAAGQPVLKVVTLFYEGITQFFTKNYKQITVEFMQELWCQIDMIYLLSLPYPANPKDQKYLG